MAGINQIIKIISKGNNSPSSLIANNILISDPLEVATRRVTLTINVISIL